MAFPQDERKRSFSVTGIVLKRTSTGEADRVITLFTREYGKLVCIAKGVRKTSSSRTSSLEPGCETKLYLVKTASLPIVTQTQLLENFSGAKNSLLSMRKLFQVLEMIDSLVVEGEAHEEIYDLITRMLECLHAQDDHANGYIRLSFQRILQLLGFSLENNEQQRSISEQIEALTQRNLRSFAYLTTMQ